MTTHVAPRRTNRAAAWIGVALLVAVVVTLGAWRVHGGRWVRVETASMGTDAPVGTLLWVAPVRFEELEPGDLITFTPPGHRGMTYSHLVAARNDDGTLTTRGRISAPDPWRISDRDVVGKVVMRWPGVGWLVLAAPILVLGGFVVVLMVRRLRTRDLRLPVGVVGAAVVLAVALVVHRPLIRAEQLSFVPVDGGARATYVSTGLLPLRLSARGARDVVLRDGQTGSVLATTGDGTGDAGRFAVRLHPSVPTSWWLVLVTVCFVPAVGRVLRRRIVPAQNRP